jgi:hypothetical protein
MILIMCFILSDTDQKICINDNKMARPSSKLAELVSFRPAIELLGTRRLLPSIILFYRQDLRSILTLIFCGPEGGAIFKTVLGDSNMQNTSIPPP